MRIPKVVLLVLVMMLDACTDDVTSSKTSPAPPTSPSVPVAAEHRIGIDGGQFTDSLAGGAPWTPRGVNYVQFVSGKDRTFAPGVWDAARVDADFALLAADGYSAVRLFIDSCNVGPDCIAEEGASGLNTEYLANVAAATHLAREHGIVLLLTSNDLPDGGPYRTISARDDSAAFPGYRNSDFLTASGHEAIATYWDDLLSGLAAEGADFSVVWGWSILNEHWLFEEQPPLSLTGGTVTTASGTYDMSDPDDKRRMVVESTRAMISTVAAVIREHDPHGLVTMGFFVPNFPTVVHPGRTWYADTAPLVEDSDLDFFDFHSYFGEGSPLDVITENFGVTDAKPVIMGEYGGFTHTFSDAPSVALEAQRWMAKSCEWGWDGWLFWAYERIPLADATWSFRDADGYIQSALAPATWTDPCVPSLTDPNLARGARVFASSELPGEPASAAVDGDPSTNWGSGGDAMQWIQVDVGSGTPIGAVELVVAQYPPGRTVHMVEVVNATHQYEVHRFDGTTTDGDVLRVEFTEPIGDAVSIRITTIVSPSWVSWYEVRILAAD